MIFFQNYKFLNPLFALLYYTTTTIKQAVHFQHSQLYSALKTEANRNRKKTNNHFNWPGGVTQQLPIRYESTQNEITSLALSGVLTTTLAVELERERFPTRKRWKSDWLFNTLASVKSAPDTQHQHSTQWAHTHPSHDSFHIIESIIMN